jgi:hypothetical protein
MSNPLKVLVKRLVNLTGHDLVRLGHEFDPLESRSSICGSMPSADPPHEGQGRDPIKVHMFWAYGRLSKLEIIAVKSFAANGYDVCLWSYDDIENVPGKGMLKDARLIIPEDEIFTVIGGSYAAFADLFRYTVLTRQGGLWADIDVICLIPARELGSARIGSFIVSERQQSGSVRINNNVIYYKRPEKGSMIDIALAVGKSFDTTDMEWGYMGPRLFTMIAKTYPGVAPAIMEPSFANPINWWECPEKLLDPACPQQPTEQWGFVHCFNETWRRAGIDKNAPYPQGSLMHRLERRFAG